jgi:predicted histone-like DNA-binding protein
MPVLYKLRQDNRKNSANKGKWYARSLNIYTMKTEDIADLIQNNCTAKYSDVVAVLREFKEVLTNALADSKAVHVDGLGTFKVPPLQPTSTPPKISWACASTSSPKCA